MPEDDRELPRGSRWVDVRSGRQRIGQWLGLEGGEEGWDEVERFRLNRNYLLYGRGAGVVPPPGGG